MMKLRIDVDEWWPMFSLEEELNEWHPDENIEVDNALWERYQRAVQEFGVVQGILETLHPRWKNR